MAYCDALPMGTELAGDYRIEGVPGAGRALALPTVLPAPDSDSGAAIKEYFPGEYAVREKSRRVTSRAEKRDDRQRMTLTRFNTAHPYGRSLHFLHLVHEN